ncbi:peptidoglycan-binding protein [Luteibacter sp. 329MFSha]|uniref:peptidoglycan-binding protein n=1 Tax=Luteibacter sp. 329MFSha TaxID=1798239 RepID=UPI0008D27C36|nr:peptidoglycan-binding protein [Luteibacter sp. 329MFSha]SEW25019.1 Putative peptidoglycan binding domain-containing protein [Luteibacter sp. 329MFSha]
MKYRELDDRTYRKLCANIIQEIEGFKGVVYRLDDGKATTGYGYTFNRNDNLAIWEKAGIRLSDTEREHLKKVDAAPAHEKTSIAVKFGRVLTKDEASNLLSSSTLANYEGPANTLGMPPSVERAAYVALTYNRGVGSAVSRMQPFRDAVRRGDRATAWYEMRYNSWGSNAGVEVGLRKARSMEAQIFGLYDDPRAVTATEARRVYEIIRDNRQHIDELERRFGQNFDGQQSRSETNVIYLANRDYQYLTSEFGAVPTISEAIAPARERFLADAAKRSPSMARYLTDEAFQNGEINVAEVWDGDLPYESIGHSHVVGSLQPSFDVSMMDNADLNAAHSRQSLRASVTVAGMPDPLDAEATMQLQENLNKLGLVDYRNEPLSVNGSYDSYTRAAVARFQHQEGLEISGVADEVTRRTIESRAFIAGLQNEHAQQLRALPTLDHLQKSNIESRPIEWQRPNAPPYAEHQMPDAIPVPSYVDERAAATQLGPYLNDPRHPENAQYALYTELGRRIPDASEDRLLQFTAACHTSRITADNLSICHLDERNLTMGFLGNGALSLPVTVDLKKAPPEPEQAVAQIAEYDQQQALVRSEYLAQQQQMSRSGPSL